MVASFGNDLSSGSVVIQCLYAHSHSDNGVSSLIGLAEDAHSIPRFNSTVSLVMVAPPFIFAAILAFFLSRFVLSLPVGLS